MKLFFDDLELPRLARTISGSVAEKKLQRAGYTRFGASTNLSVIRSLRNALGRRIALRAAVKRNFDELKGELASLGTEQGDRLLEHGYRRVLVIEVR